MSNQQELPPITGYIKNSNYENKFRSLEKKMNTLLLKIEEQSYKHTNDFRELKNDVKGVESSIVLAKNKIANFKQFREEQDEIFGQTIDIFTAIRSRSKNTFLIALDKLINSSNKTINTHTSSILNAIIRGSKKVKNKTVDFYYEVFIKIFKNYASYRETMVNWLFTNLDKDTFEYDGFDIYGRFKDEFQQIVKVLIDLNYKYLLSKFLIDFTVLSQDSIKRNYTFNEVISNPIINASYNDTSIEFSLFYFWFKAKYILRQHSLWNIRKIAILKANELFSYLDAHCIFIYVSLENLPALFSHKVLIYQIINDLENETINIVNPIRYFSFIEYQSLSEEQVIKQLFLGRDVFQFTKPESLYTSRNHYNIERVMRTLKSLTNNYPYIVYVNFTNWIDYDIISQLIHFDFDLYIVDLLGIVIIDDNFDKHIIIYNKDKSQFFMLNNNIEWNTQRIINLDLVYLRKQKASGDVLSINNQLNKGNNTLLCDINNINKYNECYWNALIDIAEANYDIIEENKTFFNNAFDLSNPIVMNKLHSSIKYKGILPSYQPFDINVFKRRDDMPTEDESILTTELNTYINVKVPSFISEEFSLWMIEKLTNPGTQKLISKFAFYISQIYLAYCEKELKRTLFNFPTFHYNEESINRVFDIANKITLSQCNLTLISLPLAVETIYTEEDKVYFFLMKASLFIRNAVLYINNGGYESLIQNEGIDLIYDQIWTTNQYLITFMVNIHSDIILSKFKVNHKDLVYIWTGSLLRVFYLSNILDDNSFKISKSFLEFIFDNNEQYINTFIFELEPFLFNNMFTLFFQKAEYKLISILLITLTAKIYESQQFLYKERIIYKSISNLLKEEFFNEDIQNPVFKYSILMYITFHKVLYIRNKILKASLLPFDSKNTKSLEGVHLLFIFMHKEILNTMQQNNFNNEPELIEIYELMKGFRDSITFHKYPAYITADNLSNAFPFEKPLMKTISSNLIQTTQLTLNDDNPYLLIVHLERKRYFSYTRLLTLRRLIYNDNTYYDLIGAYITLLQGTIDIQLYNEYSGLWYSVSTKTWKEDYTRGDIRKIVDQIYFVYAMKKGVPDEKIINFDSIDLIQINKDEDYLKENLNKFLPSVEWINNINTKIGDKHYKFLKHFFHLKSDRYCSIY